MSLEGHSVCFMQTPVEVFATKISHDVCGIVFRDALVIGENTSRRVYFLCPCCCEQRTMVPFPLHIGSLKRCGRVES